MRHLVHNVRCSVLPINSSLLTTTLYCSVITTLVQKDTKYSVPFMTLQPSSTVHTDIRENKNERNNIKSEKEGRRKERKKEMEEKKEKIQEG